MWSTFWFTGERYGHPKYNVVMHGRRWPVGEKVRTYIVDTEQERKKTAYLVSRFIRTTL